MAKAMAHMAVTVHDMQESLRFYIEAIGLQKAFEIPNPEDGSPWIVYLNVGPGQFVELFYDGTEENPWKPQQIGFNHLCFEVEDIHAGHPESARFGFCDGRYAKAGRRLQLAVLDEGPERHPDRANAD